MKVSFILWIAMLWLSSSLHAQELFVKNVRAKVVNEDGTVVEVYYSLQDDMLEGRTYIVSLYADIDGLKRKLFNVEGDVGDSVRIGNNKIVWYAQEEYPRFRGNVVFEVRAVRSFDILRPERGTVLRRGDEFTFEWFGEGSTSDRLTLEIYQNKVKIDSLVQIDGASRYLWEIPKKMPVGEGFQLKITGTDATNIEAFSAPFSIKRRVPMAAQIGAIATGIIGGVLYFTLRGPGPEEPDPLPPPPTRAD